MVGFVEFDAGGFDLQAAEIDVGVGGRQQDGGVRVVGGCEQALFFGQDGGGLADSGEGEVGDRLVDPGGVSGWRSEPQVELYSPANDRKPFFSVAVISGSDRAAWRDRLQAAFGGEKEVRS